MKELEQAAYPKMDEKLKAHLIEGYIETGELDEAYLEGIELLVDKVYELGQQVDNWISLAINPPEKPVMVLGGYYQNDEFIQDVFFYDGITKNYFTNWQPLPKEPLNK